MTPVKTLAERALNLFNRLSDLAAHEKLAVLSLMSVYLQTEAKSAELEASRPPGPAADEHFRA